MYNHIAMACFLLYSIQSGVAHLANYCSEKPTVYTLSYRHCTMCATSAKLPSNQWSQWHLVKTVLFTACLNCTSIERHHTTPRHRQSNVGHWPTTVWETYTNPLYQYCPSPEWLHKWVTLPQITITIMTTGESLWIICYTVQRMMPTLHIVHQLCD